MTSFSSIESVGGAYTNKLFGGNILADRGALEGDGQYETAIDDLGITDLRYPGGSLTEYLFDITNPDRPTAIHSETGKIEDFIPLSEFMNFADENGHAVTIVIPTRHSLTEDVDENGHRFANVDEDALRTFIKDVVDGQYGTAEIRAFEIGNEYWGSGGMDAVEYGRVAAEMTDIIDDEIMQAAEANPEAEHIDIIVQMGTNHGTSNLNEETAGFATAAETLDHFNETYDLDLGDETLYRSGNVNQTHINNELILAELEKYGSIEDVDGVVAHVYSVGELNTWSKVFALNEIEDTWKTDYPELETYVTEWNLKGSSALLNDKTDFGLFQAREMLNIFEEFAAFNVDAANIWPLIQNTPNALNNGYSYDEPNAPGEFFSIMKDVLPGKQLLDFSTQDNRKTEAEFEDFSVHGFADPEDLVLFVTTKHKEGIVEADFDISELVSGYGDIELSILGVKDGQAPGSNRSEAELEQLDPDTVIEDGFLNVNLDPGEILIVNIHDYIPEEPLAKVIGAKDDVDTYLPPEAADELVLANETAVEAEVEDQSTQERDEIEIPTIPQVSEDDRFEEDTQENEDDIVEDPSDDGGAAGLGWLLGLVPLIAIAVGAG